MAAFLRRHARQLRLPFLPPYSPQLAPIERVAGCRAAGTAGAVVGHGGAERRPCRFSFIVALFAFQHGTLAQRVPMPGRQSNDRDSKSSRDPTIVDSCICGAMRSFVGGASTSRSALYV